MKKNNSVPRARCLLSVALAFILLGLLSPVIELGAQNNGGGNRTIASGKVVDEAGEALEGVAVIIKGTSIGTATDAAGHFELDLFDNRNAVLVFSMLGMETQEIKYKDNRPVIVRLEEDAATVEQVVVTGYQKIDKHQLASSVVSVAASELLGAGQMSIDKMLQGRVAGMAVTNMSSTPGAAPKIRIRGQSSITGNREPVWVLDGIILEEPVEISAEELNSPDNVNLIGNAISFINPEDIERIDILKDASATAIYGIKAANGVIVVTTKKGKRGRPRVSYTTSLSVTAPPTYRNMYRMNSAERVAVSQEIQNRGLEFSAFSPTDVGYEGALQRYWNKELTYDQFLDQVTELKNMNTDWYGVLFNPAFSHQHTVTVSGGNDKADYYFSGGYSNDKSVTLGEGLQRYNAMVKVNTWLRRNLRLGFKLSGSLSRTDRPHKSVDLYEYAYNTSRAIPLYNADGSLAYYTASTGYQNERLKYNVLNELAHGGDHTDNSVIALNIDLDWDPFPWMKYSTVLGLSRNNNIQTSWADEQSYYITSLRGLAYGTAVPDPKDSRGNASNYAQNYGSLPFGGEYETSTTRNTSYTWRNNLLLHHKFASKHDLSANLGVEVRSSKYDGLKSTQYGYLPERGKKFADIDPAQWPRYNTLLRNHPDVITDTKNNVLSFYGTAAYVYDDRYVLNFNIRTDGSNKFGQDKSVRFLPVWSVSGRWNIANESFFEPALNVLNDLSIRASYGIQGNVHPDQTPDLITNLGTLDGISQEYISKLYKFPNNKLKWEKTSAYNLALDIALFDNRIYGSVDFYYKKGTDQVTTRYLAPSTGANQVSINNGDVENKGWDLSLSFVPVQTRDWTWNISFNTGQNFNKVLNAGEMDLTFNDYTSGTLVVNGTALNSFYSYKFAGLDDEGLPTFYDVNEVDGEGNLIVHSLDEAFKRAFTYSGKRDPDLTGGLSTYVRYKNFTFNCMFSFSVGNKIRLNALYESSGQRLPYPNNNMESEFAGRWQNPGDNTVIPVLSDKTLSMRRNADNGYVYEYPVADNRWQMYDNSDLRVVSGSYLRCRMMSLRYDFGKELMSKARLGGASISFDVGNVFTIKDKALKGRDPEQLELGSRSIPPQRSYSLRFNITF